jgi:hypothetical protein
MNLNGSSLKQISKSQVNTVAALVDGEPGKMIHNNAANQILILLIACCSVDGKAFARHVDYAQNSIESA